MDPLDMRFAVSKREEMVKLKKEGGERETSLGSMVEPVLALALPKGSILRRRRVTFSGGDINEYF